MADILVDTDVFVDHLRGFRRLDPGTERVWYSVITRCELFAGRKAREDVISLLLGPFQELPVDRAIAERAGQLRRDHNIRMPDALIAASAVENSLTLVTRHIRDFESIPALASRLP